MTDVALNATAAPTAVDYLRLIAEGWQVIEADGSHLTIQNPEDEGPQEYVISVDALAAPDQQAAPSEFGTAQTVGVVLGLVAFIALAFPVCWMLVQGVITGWQDILADGRLDYRF